MTEGHTATIPPMMASMTPAIAATTAMMAPPMALITDP